MTTAPIILNKAGVVFPVYNMESLSFKNRVLSAVIGGMIERQYDGVVLVKGLEDINFSIRAVKGFCRCEIERYARANLSPECRVISDGLACFTAVEKPGVVILALSVVVEKVSNILHSNQSA